MFFDEPYTAFRHIRGFIKDGGRALFACWGPLEKNPWVAELAEVPRRYVDMPPPDPRAPGPFAFADNAYVTDILTHAGFGGVTFTPWHGAQTFGGSGATADDAADFVMDALFIGDLLKNESDATQRRAREELRTILEAHETPDGVKLGAMAWFVSATAC